MRDLGDGERPAVDLVGVRDHDDSLPHVAGQDLRAPVAVEVGDLHVRHRRLLRDGVLERDRASHEPDRAVAGRRPRLERRQGQRGRALVILEDGLIVRGERRRRRASRAPLRDRRSRGDHRHLRDLAAPGGARQDVRRGELMAGRALDPRELLRGERLRPPRRRGDRSRIAGVPREDQSGRQEGDCGEPRPRPGGSLSHAALGQDYTVGLDVRDLSRPHN